MRLLDVQIWTSMRTCALREVEQTIVHMDKKGGNRLKAVVMVKEQDTFRGVNSDTTVVDVRYRLPAWVARELCQRAPSLKTILLAPGAIRRIEQKYPSVLRICREQGIEILARVIRPRKNQWKTRQTWKTRRPMPPSSFETPHNFLLNLYGETKDRFEELILLRFPEALATARYYCLKGEPYFSLQQVANLYGFPSASAVQDKIKAVLLYLDEKSVSSASQHARSMPRGIEKRIMLLRAKGVTSEEQLGSPLVRTPAGMPLTPIYVKEFKLVLARSLDGTLASLQRENAQDYRVLVLRFGLEDGRYRTLEEVGKEMEWITRQWVREREKRALKFLGISSPPKRYSKKQNGFLKQAS